MTSVSIIIPTYHRPRFLVRAVASALAACPPDGEVIVIDDKSDTAEAALAVQAEDQRLKITTNGGDKGPAGARNWGIARAQGDIIMFLDDDDVMVPDYPARVMAAAQGSSASFGYSNVGETRDFDAPFDASIIRGHQGRETGLLAPDLPLSKKLRGFGYGFWIRRVILAEAGHIQPEQTVDEDVDFICRLFGLGYECWFEAEPGCIITRHDEGATAAHLSTGTAGLVEAECRVRTFQRNQGYFGLRSADRWFLARRVLRLAALKGCDDAARAFLRDLTPWSWRIKGWLFWRIKKLRA